MLTNEALLWKDAKGKLDCRVHIKITNHQNKTGGVVVTYQNKETETSHQQR